MANNMETKRVDTPDDISWHVEIFNPNPRPTKPKYVVLVPSGEGDCGSLTAVATILSSPPHNYTIVTFDTPGMSRTTAPVEATTHVTPQLLSSQILPLLDALNINQAAFFGCSSGGLASLAIAATNPTRVHCCIVHEIPLQRFPEMVNITTLSDEETHKVCDFIFENVMIEPNGLDRWHALGSEYHARLKPNYLKFAREYSYAIEDGGREMFVEGKGAGDGLENLKVRPVFWTIGALRIGDEVGMKSWGHNIEIAKEAGLAVETGRLKCKHLPNVTIPEDLAAWIGECVGKCGAFD